MQVLPSQSRSDSSSSSSIGSSTTQSLSPAVLKIIRSIIQQANTVPLESVIRHYGRNIDAHNTTITCPFTKHSGGHERTGSFKYYPETNTFWCFGCKTGRTTTDFVAEMENLTPFKAAKRIFELFLTEIDPNNVVNHLEQSQYFNERLQLMIKFSNTIRQHLQSIYITHGQLAPEAEEVAEVFDRMIDKHTLDNAALSKLINKLQPKLLPEGQ